MRIGYGSHAEQHLDIVAAEGRSKGTALLLHGGYWRGSLTSDLMLPVAADLHDRGWATVNVEYRRVGAGGGWPHCRDDAIAACRTVAAEVAAGVLPGPVVAIGHSVGGQLALLAAHETPAPVNGVLALAPVTDVVETLRLGLGEDAAAALLEDVEDIAEAAREASPILHSPVGVPVSIVHGLDDDRVPVQHSIAFAHAAGPATDLHIAESLSHLALIDPSGPQWPQTLDALSGLRTLALAHANQTRARQSG